jgi:hypothetical protein
MLFSYKVAERLKKYSVLSKAEHMVRIKYFITATLYRNFTVKNTNSMYWRKQIHKYPFYNAILSKPRRWKKSFKLKLISYHNVVLQHASSAKTTKFTACNKCWIPNVSNSFPAEAEDFSLLKRVQTGSGTHPAWYVMRTELLPQEYSYRSVKILTHLHLVTRQRKVELHLRSSICFHGAHKSSFTLTFTPTCPHCEKHISTYSPSTKFVVT